jgi:hypothetical protein
MRQETMVWADRIGNPQFSNAREMEQAINGLEPAEVVIPLNPEGREEPEFRMVRNARTKAAYGMVSPKYRLIQDFEVLVPFYDVLTEEDLKPQGFFHQARNGNLHGAVFFEAPKTKAKVRVGDVVSFGLKVFNGKNGWMGYGAKGIANRLACMNGMTSAHYFGGFSTIHLKDKEEGIRNFSFAVKNLLEGIPNYVKDAHRASETPIKQEVAVELLSGAGVRVAVAEDIIAEMPILIPDLVGQGLNGWTLHNAITAYGSHNKRSPEGFETISRQAERLLKVEDYEEMILLGRERMKEEREG